MPSPSDLDRWEHGSDFHYPASFPTLKDPSAWRPHTQGSAASYWHSGRDALRALLLMTTPKRVLFPSFYCQDVYTATNGIVSEVRAYADRPDDMTIDPDKLGLRSGDLLVVTNTYGLRSRSPFAADSIPAGVTVVEDHTHDPHSRWARTTTAPYAFASLRKWFPLPDGGVLWSSTHPVIAAPEDLDTQATAVTLDRLSGMLLKARYVAGEPIGKGTFRRLLVRGEENIGRPRSPQPMSSIARGLYDALPADLWRETRRANHAAFVAALAAPPRDMHILSAGSDDPSVTPYCIVLAFDTHERREAARKHLVERRIYPAVLWPIDDSLLRGIPSEHVDLCRRVLCIHCDHRYTDADLARVAEELGRSSSS